MGYVLHLMTLNDTHTHTHTHARARARGPTRRRNVHLSTLNTHKEQTSIPTAGFEPAFLASERLKTHALHRVVTCIGSQCCV